MNIVDFELRHVAEAACLAEKQLNEERKHFPLPDASVPDLSWLADSPLSVAAEENGRMVGYLGGWGPVEGMFGTSGMPEAKQFVGVFSPVHLHAVAVDAPERTWQRLYQAAAEKWARAGAVYHAISLYEHDEKAKCTLFRYGFGQRCADAIRRVEPLSAAQVPGITLCELPKGSAEVVRELRIGLDIHLTHSPTFMLRNHEVRQKWLEDVKHRDSRLFVAMAGDKAVAFMEVCGGGENYLTEHPGMANICGAYCLEEQRGKGVSQVLLDYILNTLRAEGMTWLGVDYETMNPTAAGFWEKYFRPYTASLVRRIDR
ncbi:MAG: GNAT family N-acetyltransferase [Clostridia bacterium]|nr:GNAT family N-acetyltransferase [Clostridia bacterium]